ncbi:MAG: ABC transporter permease [Lewinellaceae bacterium]|nr:ABC transporter permease [Lewinella sp.]MCB9282332.1 ABC transporter permease [Lewinellaceae bacterium]
MFQNYLKLAIRHLLKHKSFSLLNIAGLSVGIACAALILLWVEDEVSYNAFHEKADRIFRIVENQTYEGQTYTFSSQPGLLAGAIKAEIPEIAQTARFDWGDRYAFSLGDKSTFEEGYLVDTSFLDILSFPLLEGDPKTALQETNALIVTRRMGEKFFGKESPMGKTLRVNNREDFKITGVAENPPPNSTIQFEWLGSFRIFEKENRWWNDWQTNGVQTLALLNAASDSAAVNRKLFGFIQTKEENAAARPFLFPMKDWHLRSEFKEGKNTGKGRIEYVRLFSIIAAFILLIACFNYMNLTTARSENRSREVGVRKVVGAGRNSLAGQFLSEAILTSLLATLLATGLLKLALPAFNALVDKQLTIDLSDYRHASILLAVALISGVLAGSYPSFYLSSFRPLAVLKGMSKRVGGAVSIRKGLVVAQFCVSVFLIFCTIVIYKQISHVKNRHLGYEKEGVIYMKITEQVDAGYSAIRQELMATGQVENVARSSDAVLNIGSSGGGFSWQGKDPAVDKLVAMNWGSPEYIKTLGMELSEGRDFYENPALDSMSVIVNETFANLIRRDSKQEEVAGQLIQTGDDKFRIVGVMKDFRFGDMYGNLEPLIMFCDQPRNGVVFVRFKPGQDLPGALSSVEKIWQAHNPGFPFDYKFLDDEFDRLFRSEATVGSLSLIFATLAIVICCLGLFGLAAFAAERRTKEIGVRKVLGARVSGIVGLLSKDFLKLVALSLVISSPLAWWAADTWLRNFEYRIHVPWWVFPVTGGLALAVAFLTVSFQSVRAALANPVKSLRSE